MMQSSSRAPLLPRRLLFGNPERTRVSLSPNGNWLSYLAPVEGVLNLWVAPIDDLNEARPVTHERERGIQFYEWAHSSEHILYGQDTGGDENYHLLVVDLNTGAVQDLTAVEGVHAYIAKLSPKYPFYVVVGLNDRDSRYHDLYRIDVRTGNRKLLFENPGFASFLLDNDLILRLGKQPTSDGGYELLKRSGSVWDEQPILSVQLEDQSTTEPLGLDATGGTLYILDSRGRDTAALVSMELATGELTLLHEDARSDVTLVRFHPLTGHVQAAATEYLRFECHTFDSDVATHYRRIQDLIPGSFLIVSQSDDTRRWIVYVYRDDSPLTFYLYDRDEQHAARLFSTHPGLEGASLSTQEPVVIRSRDGLDLVSYLTLPYGTPLETGRPTSPLPLVLAVHGGPQDRDSWSFDPWVAWLADRGYAVLLVNFRGSTGFGKAFINAGDREWGGKMHNDLLDAVDWAITEGIADKTRVGIIGASYGGYATLAALTFTPDVFAVGVDLVGPSNLQTMVETTPDYWAVLFEIEARRIGDPRTEEGREFLRSRSPLHRAQDISKPLLIGHGANDARVNQVESDQIVEALLANDIPVTYLLYPDEGHWFVRPENRLSFFAVAEGFLAKHLGGQAEPIGNDLEGSSVEVKAGTLMPD